MWKNLVPGERARNYLALQQPAKKGDPQPAEHLTGWKHGPKTSFIGGKVAHFQRDRSLVSFTSFILSNTSEIKNGQTPAIYHMAGD